MELGLLCDFLGIFPHKVKDNILGGGEHTR